MSENRLFCCDVPRREIYQFYNKEQSPSLKELLMQVKSVMKIPSEETTFQELLKELGFVFRLLRRMW